MIDSTILDNHSEDEILEALHADLAELVQKSRRARQVGDKNQEDILHRLINEDLDMLLAITTPLDPAVWQDHLTAM